MHVLRLDETTYKNTIHQTENLANSIKVATIIIRTKAESYITA